MVTITVSKYVCGPPVVALSLFWLGLCRHLMHFCLLIYGQIHPFSETGPWKTFL